MFILAHTAHILFILLLAGARTIVEENPISKIMNLLYLEPAVFNLAFSLFYISITVYVNE